MIPEHKQQPLAEALAALDADDEQTKYIGNMCFTVCALPAGHDTDFLLLQMHDDDPLIRTAARMMLDSLT